ncbi:hypothetical protein PGTUg99_030353 [Puccinia graminis f. sp. tritici]|uniref:Uncharacterized protein n=1 Tax=Puccinia graminis f. sp. tritici TaxID=56615 RepID=A0A5B0QRZ1_PUCGR|nr:hypothetical protein PGTUg99_030353 [Puccinia graminis f. sp. tritici]
MALALPPNWRTTLKGKFNNLRMANLESFITYSTQSLTLQSMLNFDLKTEAISDSNLADSMMLERVDSGMESSNNPH